MIFDDVLAEVSGTTTSRPETLCLFLEALADAGLDNPSAYHLEVIEQAAGAVHDLAQVLPSTHRDLMQNVSDLIGPHVGADHSYCAFKDAVEESLENSDGELVIEVTEAELENLVEIITDFYFVENLI